jgi:hypothetical protein
MDFIERWLGISPDGGDGSLEALYLFVLLAIVSAVMFRKHIIALFRR